MFYKFGSLVYDTSSWFSCDKKLCELFGVHFTDSKVHEAHVLLWYKAKLFLYEDEAVSLSITKGGKIVLSNIAHRFKGNSICLDTNDDVILVFDDRLSNVRLSMISDSIVSKITVDLTNVTDEAILNMMYGFKGKIIDNPDRIALYSPENYINGGVMSSYFNSDSLTFYWRRNRDRWVLDANRIWFLLVDNPVNDTLRITLMQMGEEELLRYLKERNAINQFSKEQCEYILRLIRYFDVGGVVTDEIRLWVRSFKRGVIDVLCK